MPTLNKCDGTFFLTNGKCEKISGKIWRKKGCLIAKHRAFRWAYTFRWLLMWISDLVLVYLSSFMKGITHLHTPPKKKKKSKYFSIIPIPISQSQCGIILNPLNLIRGYSQKKEQWMQPLSLLQHLKSDISLFQHLYIVLFHFLLLFKRKIKNYAMCIQS